MQEAIGDAPPELQQAYGLMLGLSSHDISAMRELLGMPKPVPYAAQRHGGLYMTAAFDYGDYICHYETGIDAIPRFDAHLHVFVEKQTLRVQYNTPAEALVSRRRFPLRRHVELISTGGWPAPLPIELPERELVT